MKKLIMVILSLSSTVFADVVVCKDVDRQTSGAVSYEKTANALAGGRPIKDMNAYVTAKGKTICVVLED